MPLVRGWVDCGSIYRTGVVFLLSKLYSQSSNVCARECHMGQCVRSLHPSVEWPGLRQVVHCTGGLNRVSSVVGRAFWSDVIDMLWALLSRRTRLMTSSMRFPVRSTTAKVVRSGSRRLNEEYLC